MTRAHTPATDLIALINYRLALSDSISAACAERAARRRQSLSARSLKAAQTRRAKQAARDPIYRGERI